MAFCTKCGTESSPGQRFCVVCGSALPESPPESATANSSSASSPSPAPSAMPPWTPAPPLSAQDVAGFSSSQVLVGFASEPPVQGRLTVLFRGVLAIPLLIWSSVLSIAAVIAVVISWFAALVTGWVPEGLQTFNFSVVRYTIEVQAYISVMVARWPGFALNPGDGAQVSLQINRFKLNRAAVFFRYLLGLPAGVVFFVVNFASYVLTLAAWISALIMGRPARPIYQARLLCLRYSARYTAYVFMLTPTQPFAGLFGDSVVPDVASDEVPGGLSTIIRATRGARIALVVSLLMGAAGGVVYFQRVGNLQKLINNSLVVPLVNTTQANVLGDLTTYEISQTSCAVTSSVTCTTTAAVTARDAIATQLANLSASENFVVTGKSQYLAYEADLQKINSDFSRIAADVTWAQQRSDIVQRLQPDIHAFVVQYQVLRSAI